MFQCHVCGSTEAQENLVDEVFRVNGKLFVVTLEQQRLGYEGFFKSSHICMIQNDNNDVGDRKQ
ncbi:hypothetical protein HC766_08875 [Candidatus Gracilibacteria bacterium]|nr:hypothetical protein [Candidatus Gracilibacteria bacterium]